MSTQRQSLAPKTRSGRAPSAPLRSGSQAVTEAHCIRSILGSIRFRTYGVLGTETPIMLSRVTNSASSVSLMPAVPAGRMGSTM